MRSKNRATLLGTLLTLVLAGGNSGCGGGQAAVNAPPIVVSVSPASATIQAGGTQLLTATVQNDPANKGVTWTISPATGAGTLSNITSMSVTYNAPTTAPTNALSVTITAASVTDTSKSATVPITVPARATGITVSLNPAPAMLPPGGSVDITGSTNDPSGVTWTLSPATGAGTLGGEADQAGSLVASYTAPATISSTSLTVTVTATSVSDPTKSASVAITVTTAIFLAVSCGKATRAPIIQVGGTMPCSATVTNDPNSAGVTWSVAGCTGGASVCGSMTNINNSGLFTADYVAPAAVPTGGQVNVVATSVTDPTKSAFATVTISPIDFTAHNYPAGSTPNDVAVADFNGDGKLDVAVADFGNPSTGDNGGVSILLGNGDGRFQPAVSFSAGKSPISIAVGDFNNDGKQDLVLTVFGNRSAGGNGSISILLGNGNGTFQAPISLTAGPEPFALALGDFNNDGKLDFAVTDFSAGVYVFLGNGDGTFRQPALISTNNPSAIVAGDFIGNGKLDLAVAGGPLDPLSNSNSTVSILLSNGDGTFAAPVPYAIGDFLPTSIASGDLNGDKKPDLVITQFACVFGLCGSNTGTLLGNGDGTFQPIQYVWSAKAESGGIIPLSVHIVDFTGSGKADLVEVGGSNFDPHSLVVLPGNGDGTFQGALFFSADIVPFALAIGDFNGDGKPDIVVANQASNDITILLNTTVP